MKTIIYFKDLKFDELCAYSRSRHSRYLKYYKQAYDSLCLRHVFFNNNTGVIKDKGGVLSQYSPSNSWREEDKLNNMEEVNRWFGWYSLLNESARIYNLNYSLA